MSVGIINCRYDPEGARVVISNLYPGTQIRLEDVVYREISVHGAEEDEGHPAGRPRPR